MGPDGRIRTGISVVDSDALYRLSHLGVAPAFLVRRTEAFVGEGPHAGSIRRSTVRHGEQRHARVEVHVRVHASEQALLGAAAAA